MYAGLAQPILSRQACRRLGVLQEVTSYTILPLPASHKQKQPKLENKVLSTCLKSFLPVPTPRPVGEKYRNTSLNQLFTSFPKVVDGVCRIKAGGLVMIKLCSNAAPEQTTRLDRSPPIDRQSMRRS